MKSHKLFFIYLLLLLNSCKTNDPKPVVIDPIFQKYVDTFLSEAAKRGKDIDLSKVGMTLQFGDGVAEGKSYPYWGLTTIESATININKNLWPKWRENIKEYVVYHEIGHLLLKRDHLSKLWANGEVQSIMFSPEESFAAAIPLFQGIRQKYYFDELLNSNPDNQEEPVWCKAETANTPPSNIGSQPTYQENFDNGLNLSDSLLNKSNLNYSFLGGNMLINNTTTELYSINFKSFIKGINPEKVRNYEIKYRFKNKGSMLGGFNWDNYNSTSNAYFFRFDSSNQAVIFTNSESYFYNFLVKPLFGDWNEAVLRYENSMINIWLNDKLLFRTDVILPINGDSWKFELHVPQKTSVEIDYLKIYQL